jgi:O-antigen/teichoic acid export membrane protein
MEQPKNPPPEPGDAAGSGSATNAQMPNSEIGDSASALLTKSAAFSASMYISKCTDAIGGLLVAKFLGPTVYGLRNAFGLALRYEELTQLGTYLAVNRIAPYHRGRGDSDTEAEMRDSVFVANMAYATLACGIFLIAAFILSGYGADQAYVDLCFFFGVMTLTGRLLRFLHNELRIDKRMFSLSRVTILKSVLNAVAGPAMAFTFGLRGFLVALALTDVVSIAYLIFHQNVRPSVRRFRFAVIPEILRVGLPMTLVLTLGLLLRSSDRLVIIFVLSATALGYYGFAVMAVTIVTIIPTAIHNVTLAPIMELYGASQDRRRIGKYLVGPTLLMAYLLPLMISVLYFAIELPIAWWFSEYLESVVAIKLLIFSAYLQAIATPSGSVMFALDRQVQVAGLVLPLVLLSVGLNFAILLAGFGINGVAVGVCFVYVIYLLVMTIAAARQFDSTLRDYLRFIGMVIAPVVYSVCLVFAIEYFFAGIEGLLTRSILQIVVFSMAYVWIVLPMKDNFAFASLFQWVRAHLIRVTSR